MVEFVGGTIFLKSIDPSGRIKDEDYVSNLFVKTSKDVGEGNIVQIITYKCK